MKTVVFDLDGTLTESKEPIDEEMAALLTKLLQFRRVVITSGASWEQIQKQVLNHLLQDLPVMNNLYFLPASGSCMYQAWGKYGWIAAYQEKLSKGDVHKIIKSIESTLSETGFEQPKKLWGKQIENREGQITFSALGQNAPIDEKDKYDPNFSKRRKIVNALQKKLPGFEVVVSGTTSVDITRDGVNKKFGIDELMKRLHISKDDVTYVGDFIFKGGSNYAAIEMGLDYSEVRGPEDTKKWIREVLDAAGELEKTA